MTTGATIVLDLEGRFVRGWSEGWHLGNKACAYLSGGDRCFYSVREKDGHENGKYCRLDEEKGLAEPAKVALRAGRLVVWERAAQRGAARARGLFGGDL